MTSSKNLEEFWTRGDIYSRVRKAMIEADLIDKTLDIEDLFPIDQYHARGIAATVDLGKRMPILKNQKIHIFTNGNKIFFYFVSLYIILIFFLNKRERE